MESVVGVGEVKYVRVELPRVDNRVRVVNVNVMLSLIVLLFISLASIARMNVVILMMGL